MKRIVSLLLVAVLAVVAVPASLLSAFALETTQISPAVSEGFEAVYSGDAEEDGFQVAINAALADGIGSFAAYDITVSWDASVLALAADGISFAEGASADRQVNTQEGSVHVVSASATDYITDGTLFTVTFYPLKALVTADISVTVASAATASGLIEAVGGSVSVPVAQKLPEGASTIMYAGCNYVTGVSIILAGDNKTVRELTLATNGTERDLNAFALFVVDADNIVTETHLVYGRENEGGIKFDVVCPEGGYIIGYHQDLTPPAVQVGHKITLYNVDLDALRSATTWTALSNAGFTFETPNTQVTVNVNDNAVLTDGVTDATETWFGGANAKSVLIGNSNCKKVAMDVTVQYALGETKKIDGVSLYFFHESVTMIGYPEGQATVSVSTDGETYTEVGKFDFADAGLSKDTHGTVKNEFAFDAVDAAYVQVVFTAGSNEAVLGSAPADGKVNWEFVALTEVAVSEYTHEHSYTAVVTEPTLAKAGYTTYTCVCGDFYTDNEVPAVKAQPDTLVDLPSDAIAIDYAGYKHAAFVSIVAGDSLTVSQLTALGNNGAAKDMNYAYIAVVDASNTVVSVDCGLQISKADVVCPEGGYIISYNCNKASYDVMKGIKVGDKITLYNIDVDTMRGVADNVALTKAGFTYATPAPAEKDVETKDIDILTQDNPEVTGDWGSGASASNVYLIANDKCTESEMIVTLLQELGETKTVDGVTVSFYHNANVMIGYPEGQATVLVSTDGETYTEVGKFDFETADLAIGSYGTVTSNFTFDAVEAAYVKVLFTVGSNEEVLGSEPAGGKVNWEFVGLTQFKVAEAAATFVRGDINGNGEIDAKDYMILKRYILGTYTMTDEELARADVDLNGAIEAKDYIMLKRVFLGTYSFESGSLV